MLAFGLDVVGEASAVLEDLPSEDAGHPEVPDGADEDAADGRQEPVDVGGGEEAGEGSTGEGAGRADDQVDGEAFGDGGGTFEAAIAEGEFVVEEEVPDDGEEGGHDLGLANIAAVVLRDGEEGGQLDGDAGEADERVLDVANGEDAAQHFVEQEQEVFTLDGEVQLAFAVDAGFEGEGDFGEADGAGRGGDQVQEDFEAGLREAADDFEDEALADGEEAAHGVRELGF